MIKKHLDLYLKHYPNTLLVISDDFVGSRHKDDGSKEQIYQYIKAKGLTLRDDSIAVSCAKKILVIVDGFVLNRLFFY